MNCQSYKHSAEVCRTMPLQHECPAWCTAKDNTLTFTCGICPCSINMASAMTRFHLHIFLLSPRNRNKVITHYRNVELISETQNVYIIFLSYQIGCNPLNVSLIHRPHGVFVLVCTIFWLNLTSVNKYGVNNRSYLALFIGSLVANCGQHRVR